MKALLIVTAVLEAATGVGFLLSPPVGFRLLLGASLDTPGALAIARVAGAPLVALDLACWLASRDACSHAARRRCSGEIGPRIRARQSPLNMESTGQLE